jgi:hypothetical protein
VKTASNYYIPLNWSSSPLELGKTYDVDVRAYKNGAWCTTGTQWGASCMVTIGAVAATGGSQNMTLDNAPTTTLRLFPNPNRGDRLTLNLSAVEEGVSTVSMDIFDMAGHRVTTRTLAVNDGNLYQVVELNDLASGIYMVNITAGSQRFIERLVIQK